MIGAIAIAVVAVIAAVVAITATNGDDGDDTASPAGGIEVDQATISSPDGLQLAGLDVDVRNDPPLVGDTATVSYTLTNVTDEPIEFTYTFVGARNPDDENRDPEDMNEGIVLAPDDTVSAQGRVFLDSAGTRLVWPCYELVGGQVCPDEWQVTTFLVE